VIKHLLGAAVIVADVVFGLAAPAAFRTLQHPGHHGHLVGAIVLYAALGLATLWVILSVAKGPKPKQAVRSGGYPYGGQR
jgi:hypothetical protein